MAVTLDRFEAETLGVGPGSPAIVLTRTVFGAKGEIVELARDVYRGDRTEFNVTAPVEGIDPSGAGGSSRPAAHRAPGHAAASGEPDSLLPRAPPGRERRPRRRSFGRS